AWPPPCTPTPSGPPSASTTPSQAAPASPTAATNGPTGGWPPPAMPSPPAPAPAAAPAACSHPNAATTTPHWTRTAPCGCSGSLPDSPRRPNVTTRSAMPDRLTESGGHHRIRYTVRRGGRMLTLGTTSLIIVAVIAVIALAALVLAVVLRRQVLAAPEGTSAMTTIATAIQEGASAFL